MVDSRATSRLAALLAETDVDRHRRTQASSSDPNARERSAASSDIDAASGDGLSVVPAFDRKAEKSSQYRG
jgi:hypothetical protein